MSENKPNKQIKNLEFRARLPRVFRLLAVGGLVLILIAVGIGFYMNFGKQDFRMKGARELQLSKDVIAEISGYERSEADEGKLKFLIRADRARTYADNHQEMDNIYLQVFDETGEKFDIIKAERAIYLPDKENSKLFKAFFAGDVSIESRDALKVKTDQLTYTKQTEIAEAEEYIEFSRGNVSGNSVGAIVNVAGKTLELLKDVEIFARSGEGELAEGKIDQARIVAGHAFFDQPGGKIQFDQGVKVNVVPPENSGEMMAPTDLEAARATAFFTEQELNKVELSGNVLVYLKPTAKDPGWTKTRAERAEARINKELKRLELFENVDIETTAEDARPTRIKSGYALYEKDADRFELKNGVEINTVENDRPTAISSNSAIFEQTKGNIYLTGAAQIKQGNDLIKADRITAYLLAGNKLKAANAAGNAYLRQITPERTTEVSAAELNTVFDDQQVLQTAGSRGASTAVLIPAQSDAYTSVSLKTPVAIRLNFQNGLINQMQTDGRTTISLNVPDTDPQASNKKLTADSVTTQFGGNGRDLTRAEAVGNAELFIEPLRSSAENYQTTINAPRFDCDFFPGNNAKSCTAATGVTTVRVPTVPADNRGKQTLAAQRMNVLFSAQTNDLEKMEAAGQAKFAELDRQGIADQMYFTQSDQIVRLRGGDPTVWDSRARARAGEIDWDTRSERSFLRGKVATTYYSQAKTGGATPFGDARSPVFLTSDEASFDHRAESGVYTGNARAWQDNNYVRADRLVIQQKDGKMFGEGNVQSLLYNARRKEEGRDTTVPVYAAADRLFYVRADNFIRYEGNADIRQATDRLLAGRADIYLNDNNEVSQTIVERDVVITQPNRKATGEYAKYNAGDESVILKGNPATIDDRENGSSKGAQFTFYMRGNRFISESKTPENNTGRIRSVYKVKTKPED